MERGRLTNGLVILLHLRIDSEGGANTVPPNNFGGARMKTYLFIPLLFLILICICSACQPTPTDQPVENKGNNELQVVIKKTADTAAINANLDIPETWEESYFIDSIGLDVIISASVNAPENKIFPVIKIEPDKFEKKKVDKIINELFEDVEVFEGSLIQNEEELTKSQIENRIFQLKNQLNNPNSDFNNPEEYESEEEYNSNQQRVKDQIEELEKLYETAPKTIENVPLSITEDKLQDGLGGFVFADNNEDKIRFFISDNDAEKGRVNSFTCFYPRSRAVEGDQNPHEISESTAGEMAKQIVADLGADDMELNRIIDWDVYSENGYKKYDVVFTKSYDDITETYTVQEQGQTDIDEKIYTFPWFYEKILVTVDNYGVANIRWLSPSKEKEVLSENVKIIDLEEAMSLFKKNIEYKAAWNDDNEFILSRQLYIDEIRLGMMRVSVKDSIDSYMVIPVWDFFGYSVDKYSEPQPGGWQLDENNEFVNKVNGHSFLTINAIDGSIIDRNLGY